jgi:hypothetical protein
MQVAKEPKITPLGLAALIVRAEDVLKHHAMALLPSPTHIRLSLHCSKTRE